MKIIKQGDLSRLKNPKMFSCTRCWCVFEAIIGEYEYDQRDDVHYCKCPCCGSGVREDRVAPPVSRTNITTGNVAQTR